MSCGSEKNKEHADVQRQTQMLAIAPHFLYLSLMPARVPGSCARVPSLTLLDSGKAYRLADSQKRREENKSVLKITPHSLCCGCADVFTSSSIHSRSCSVNLAHERD